MVRHYDLISPGNSGIIDRKERIYNNPNDLKFIPNMIEPAKVLKGKTLKRFKNASKEICLMV